MISRSTGRVRSVALAALVVVSTGFASAAAASATADSAAITATGPEAPVCVTVLDKLEPGARFSRVVSRKCGDDLSTALAATPGITAQVLIFTLIEHADYGGAYDHVYGGARCDAAGYGINPGWYEWRLSSFLVDGGCRYTTLTNHSGSSRRFDGDTPYVTSTYNDNVDAIRVTGGFSRWKHLPRRVR